MTGDRTWLAFLWVLGGLMNWTAAIVAAFYLDAYDKIHDNQHDTVVIFVLFTVIGIGTGCFFMAVRTVVEGD